MTFAERVVQKLEGFDPDRLEDWEEGWLMSGAMQDEDGFVSDEEFYSDEWYNFPMEGDDE